MMLKKTCKPLPVPTVSFPEILFCTTLAPAALASGAGAASGGEKTQTSSPTVVCRVADANQTNRTQTVLLCVVYLC